LRALAITTSEGFEVEEYEHRDPFNPQVYELAHTPDKDGHHEIGTVRRMVGSCHRGAVARIIYDPRYRVIEVCDCANDLVLSATASSGKSSLGSSLGRCRSGLPHSPFVDPYSSGVGKFKSGVHVFAGELHFWFCQVAFMSNCSREQALLQSVEEITQLIAELHDLRMRVRRAEATALARRHLAASDPQALVVAPERQTLH